MEVRLKKVKPGETFPCTCGVGVIMLVTWSKEDNAYAVICRCGEKHLFTVTGKEV